MPQETNLNVNPYFDDFDSAKNYYKVLFKPGTPVQARELSTLQSILQNQIEQFGTNFFKEGAKVIPGNLTYDNNFFCVEIESTFLGIPVSLYLNQLKGIRITGERSGVTATVRKVLTSEESERGNITLYVKYEKSGSEDFSTEKFFDGENLITDRDIIYGLNIIAQNETFGITIASGASSTGSAMSIGEGVYFVRGCFVQNHSETLILDQYNNRPSYRIGFDVAEEFITADEDPDLNDNASGFTNFAAPGADRLKITIQLSKKDLQDKNDQNFIEIARVENGTLQSFVKDTQYNLIRDTLAARTYDESGDYYVKPFELFAKESLNDQVGNKGIYTSEQKTQQGGTPSKDLMLIQASPGKAYVKGYDIQKIASTFIDVEKPRTTKKIEQESVNYSTGAPIFVNNVFGSPSLGIGTTATVSLVSTRRAGLTTVGIAPGGEEVGVARLYDFKAQSASYVNEATKYEVRLIDIKTFTKIKVGIAITSVADSDHIEGARSGAQGFVYGTTGANKSDLTLVDTIGKFVKDESILINGVAQGRVITKVSDYGMNDVKSFKSSVGVSTFEADMVLDGARSLSNQVSGSMTLVWGAGNTGTITAAGNNFAGIITSGNIISYPVAGKTVPTFNKITGVSTDGTTINVTGITTVPNVMDGGVPTGTTNVTALTIRRSLFNVNDNTITTPLNHKNIASLDVTNTTVQFRKQYSGINVSSNSFTSPDAGTNLFFQPFDEERYFISYADGSIEPLQASQMSLSANKKTVTFVGLSKASGKANLFATVLKGTVVTKKKNLNEANTLVINRSKLTASGIGTNTLNDGLTHSNVYGTRVQDKFISLQVPESVSLAAVYESNDSGDPDLPSLVLGGYSGPSGNNTDLIIGERLTGVESNAVGMVVERPNTVNVGIVPLNSTEFIVGETVKSNKSGVAALVGATTRGDRNVTEQYMLGVNDRANYYDFSYVRRKKDFGEPKNRLKIVFKNFFVNSDDDGDFFSASSYPEDSKDLIPPSVMYELRSSDLIDIRPRVKTYDTTTSISPFNFKSRIFSDDGASIPDPLVPDESIIVSYDYYLGRSDRLFLDINGTWEYIKGTPADLPTIPQPVGDAIEVATIDLAPYVYDLKNDVMITRTKHKRFTMADIGRLEERLKNVEYYTRLSLLESDTKNMSITDANGLNRFKSGFFVDNFKTHDAHQIAHPDFSASIDAKNAFLRPGHYTTAIDLIVGSQSLIGIGTTANPTLDINYVTDIDGSNVKKTGRLVTLDYNEKKFLEQGYASRVENVNPFLIVFYAGDIKLNPDSDIWMDTKRLDANVIRRTSEYDNVVAQLGIDSQTGLSEMDWGAWETDWSSEKITTRTEVITEKLDGPISPQQLKDMGVTANLANHQNVNYIPDYGMVKRLNNGNWVPRGGGMFTDVTLTHRQEIQDIEITDHQSREGIQYKVTPVETEESLGDRMISRDRIPFMRARNIEVTNTRMKPRTKFYTFFDGVDVTQYMTPKLLEITMDSGLFQTGETINGFNASTVTAGGTPEFRCRLATPNHKYGPYNDPTDVFGLNPYVNNATLPASYSTSSSLLNVDTFSLASEVTGTFYGHVTKGMKIKGQTSGAEATISDVRMISDSIGNLICSFNIPNPNVEANPRWETGTKTLRMTTSAVNSEIGGTVTGSAETNFYAQGELDTIQENVLSIKTPQIERLTTEEQRVIQDRIVSRPGERETDIGSAVQYYDPLAQTFRVEEATGIFLTSVDVFMRDKDAELPLTLQVRTVETGLPTSKILPFAIVVKEPKDVNISEDASIPTRFTFESPVYLAGENEFAIVLVTPAENYNCWISRMGEIDISTANLPDEQQVMISQQPYLGSLFKSQNGTTWDPSQYEDMKFNLYKAEFNTGTPGTARFYNPDLAEGNGQIPTLQNNAIEVLSRKAVVGLGTTFSTPAGFVPGVTVTQEGNLYASATLTGVAGIASVGAQTFTIVNPGIGYTPQTGSLAYTSIPLPTLSGSGTGMIGNVTVNNGQISAVTVTTGGQNFALGDTVGVGTLGLGNGSGAVLAVGVVTSNNTLLLENIQGSFNTGVGTITYNNGSNVVVVGKGVTVNSFDIDSASDGLHFKVNHRAHGMHAFNNLVTISRVESDVPVTTLTADLSNTSTDDISVSSSSNFSEFEGVGVGTTNYGYLEIGDEIISYTGTSSGSITGITTRGVDASGSFSYPSGTEVRKYELGGVSLRRINRTHDMNDPAVTIANAKDLDYYHLKVDMNSNGSDRSGGSLSNRYFASTKRTGGKRITASQNMQFETLTPNVQTMTPPGTGVSARVRTISATSMGGSEESFVDQGFDNVDIGGQNPFDTPRMIASKVNENNKVTSLPGNKSMTFEVNMTSTDTDLSPVIDLDRVSLITTTNRINNPVSDFAKDRRIDVTGDDPCSATYVSKLVTLQNPATSLMVEFAAMRPIASDIRCFYKIITEGSTENSLAQNFEPFPGYTNIDQNGKIKNVADNNGLPDTKVTPSIGGQFKDHTFNSRELPPFSKFQIKIDMVGTNQATPPLIKELRAIALA